METKEIIAAHEREFKRTTGCSGKWVYCGGGWYAWHEEGARTMPAHRAQKKQILAMLSELRYRPDATA